LLKRPISVYKFLPTEIEILFMNDTGKLLALTKEKCANILPLPNGF